MYFPLNTAKQHGLNALKRALFFLLESYKAYSFTLFKAVDFAISTINILIIDVNLAHTYIKKKTRVKMGGLCPHVGRL